MKVILELQPIIYDTAKMGVMYKVNNVKFDNIDIDSILNTKLSDAENARYADMAEAMADYYNDLNLTLRPID